METFKHNLTLSVLGIVFLLVTVGGFAMLVFQNRGEGFVPVVLFAVGMLVTWCIACFVPYFEAVALLPLTYRANAKFLSDVRYWLPMELEPVSEWRLGVLASELACLESVFADLQVQDCEVGEPMLARRVVYLATCPEELPVLSFPVRHRPTDVVFTMVATLRNDDGPPFTPMPCLEYQTNAGVLVVNRTSTSSPFPEASDYRILNLPAACTCSEMCTAFKRWAESISPPLALPMPPSHDWEQLTFEGDRAETKVILDRGWLVPAERPGSYRLSREIVRYRSLHATKWFQARRAAAAKLKLQSLLCQPPGA